MAGDERPKLTPWEAVFDTLYRSMGGWVNQDKIYLAAKDVLTALGIEDTPGYPDTGEVRGPDAPLTDAIKALLEFRPEGYSEEFAAFVAASDWRDDSDPVVQEEALNDREAWAAKLDGRPVTEVVEGSRTGRRITRRVIPNPGAVPFLSQAAYYPVLGKEDGRTLNAYLREVRRLAGLEETP